MSFTKHQAAIAARLVELLAGGMTVYEAADEVGYSWTYCYAILRAAGHGIMPRPSADRPAQVAAAFAELGSMSAVARSMKMGRQTVRRLLVEQGIAPPINVYPAEVKARFLALVEQGWTTRGAAGEVGIKRDLGYYWRREAAKPARRAEAGQTRPAGYNDAVNTPTSLGSGRFLSEQDRLARVSPLGWWGFGGSPGHAVGAGACGWAIA
jgi:transposase-like protein